MKILNDKFGLSYLSGNAQILYANTASLQQFDTIIANTFTTTGNVFTVNVGGVYSNGFFATSGNISAANIIISGNLFLGGDNGTAGQYIQKSASGIAWVNSAFNGGTITLPMMVNTTNYVQSFSSPNVVISGGYVSSIANITTAVNGNINTGAGGFVNAHYANVLTHASVTTGNISNFSSSNVFITGGYLQTVSNVYATGIGNFGNLTSANIYVTRGTDQNINFYLAAGVYSQVLGPMQFVTGSGSLQAANASITTTASSIGVRTGGVVDAVANLYAITGRFTQVSAANIYLGTSARLQGGGNNSIILTSSGAAGSNISITGNLVANTLLYTSAVIEPVAIYAGTAPSGEMNIDLMANSTHYYTPAPTGLWTPNVRAGSGTPLNDLLPIGRQITFSMIVNQGATPRNNNSGNLRIDNTWYTAKWPSAIAPTAVANRTEIYTYTLIKTAAGTWVVLGSSSSNA